MHEADGSWCGGRTRVVGCVTRSPERRSSSGGRDEGVPLRRLRGYGPRTTRPVARQAFMNNPGLESAHRRRSRPSTATTQLWSDLTVR